MRRRYKYPLVTIGVITALLLLVVGVVYVVLQTDLPRRIVMGQIEKELGLKISADQLHTSLSGKTYLTDVQLTLPAGTKSFLTVDRLDIRHTSLLGLVTGQAVAVDSIEIRHPVIYVLQDEQGQWNLQQVATLIGHALGGQTAQQSTAQPAKSSGVPKLPAITVADCEVHVVDNQKRTTDLKPINLTGTPDGLLVYRYKANVADAINADGFVQPGANWVHQVDVTVQHLDPVLKAYLVQGKQHLSTYEAQFAGTWRGRLESGGKIAGQMAINTLRATNLPNVGDVSAGGGIGVVVDGPTVTVSPNKLAVTLGPTTRPAVTVDSGAVVADATGVHARQLTVSALGGTAAATADFDPKTQNFDLRAESSGLSLKNQSTKGSVLTASLRQPFAGQPVIKVQLDTNGQSFDLSTSAVDPVSTWQAQLDLTGQGTSWQNVDWVLTAPKLGYQKGKTKIDLSRLSAHVMQRDGVVRLTDLTLPQTAIAGNAASMNVSGNYNDDKQDWNVDTSAEYTANYSGTPVPMRLALAADGRGVRSGVEIVDLKRLRLDVGDTFVTVTGSYDVKTRATTAPATVTPAPVALHVKLGQTPRIAAVTEGPIQGSVDGEFDITGDLFKNMDPPNKGERRFFPYLHTTGYLRTSDLIVLGKPIDRIDVKLDGDTKTPKEEVWTHAVTSLRSTNFFLFDAPWNLAINYPVDDKAEISLETHALSVKTLGKLVGVTGFDGNVASAKWTVRADGLSLGNIDLESHYLLTDLRAGNRTYADSVEASVTLKNGIVRLDPVLARSGSGTIKTVGSFDLNRATEVDTTTEVRNWPYRLSDAVDVRTTADARLGVQIRKPDAFHDKTQVVVVGDLTASADVLQHNAVKTLTLVHADLALGLRNQTINLTKLDGNILSGSFKGTATIDYEKPLEAVGRFEFADVDAGALVVLNPKALEGLRGTYGGTIVVGPSDREPRPIGPVRMDVNIACEHGGYRSVDIGGDRFMAVHAVTYLDKDRVVLDHSTIAVAGGTVNIWGRVGRSLSSQLITIDVKDLDLNQLAHVSPSVKGPMPGVINGRWAMVSSGPDISTLQGAGHFDLVRTDLANFGPVAALYNAFNAGGGMNPTGYGSVDLAIEQGTARVTGFKFFNRGIDAGGIATIGPLDFDDVENTPVSGQVGGAVRPLKNSQIPGMDDLDQLTSAFQGTLTTFNVRGSLRDIVANRPGAISPAGFDEIGSSLSDIFGGRSAK